MIKALCARFASVESEAWETLTRSQIAARCRSRAGAAIALAEGTPDESVSYLETAETWMRLAADIEWAAEKTALGRTRTAATPSRQLGKVT